VSATVVYSQAEDQRIGRQVWRAGREAGHMQPKKVCAAVHRRRYATGRQDARLG